ncbi:MAG: cytochrome c-type biogenesis protein CcmH [Acidobacteria bacterium]|nr:cytochrome c-type biogenesis protein CcmH [Acidobacteriota bacterium]
MRNKLFVAALGTLLLAAAVMRGEGPAPTVKSVGDKVMCLCGCVAILNQCPHQGCSTHDEVQAAIQELIAQGKSEREILQALTARYGTKILAAPPTTGFNIVAWVLPGLGLIFGLLVVILLVRRWRRPREAPTASPATEVDPKVLAALEAEIKESGLGTRV